MGGLRFKIVLLGIWMVHAACTGQAIYSVEMLPFNSREFDEMAPVVYKDGLVFCSNRYKGKLISYNTPGEKPLFDYYFVQRKEKDKWEWSASLFSAELTSIFHEGPLCFDATGTKVFFTRNNESEQAFGGALREGNFLGIFLAENKGSGWANIRPFRNNNTDYNVAFPALSPDGKKLYYCSDKPGGYGGYDIYVSVYERSNWSEGVNLGPTVNSKNNEIMPFVHPSGRLFFSSDRPAGVGNQDVYYSEPWNGAWVAPILMPAPINSRYDDFGVWIDADFKSGFLTSARNRSDDIFRFSLSFPDFGDCKEQKRNNYCFEFYESGSINVDTTSFRYEWDLGDGTKVRGLTANHCFKGPGSYFIQLNVIDTLTGEVFQNEAAYEFLLEDLQQVFISCPDSVVAGSTVKPDSRQTNLKDFVPGAWYWDFGDGTFVTGAEPVKAFYTPGTYTLKLGMVNIPGRREEERKSCSTKKINVLAPKTTK